MSFRSGAASGLQTTRRLNFERDVGHLDLVAALRVKADRSLDHALDDFHLFGRAGNVLFLFVFTVNQDSNGYFLQLPSRLGDPTGGTADFIGYSFTASFRRIYRLSWLPRRPGILDCTPGAPPGLTP